MDLSSESCTGLGEGTPTFECISTINTTIRYNAVYHASLQGDKSLIQLLLEKGADVNM